jgi:serine/threonine protein phosphatase PrpC
VSKTAGQSAAPRLKVVSAGQTDVGRKRNHNEDSFLIDDELQLYVVADGMGGHTAAQEDPRLSGMGTTVISLVVRDDQAFFAHVGDSRAYLIRGELIQQISEDHSLVNEQIKAGMITPEEAKHSRYKNIITRSVGFEEEVQVDVMGVMAEPGDVYLLCSDGLANMLEDREIHELVNGTPNLQDMPKRLIDMANERGGDDNITVIVVQIQG